MAAAQHIYIYIYIYIGDLGKGHMGIRCTRCTRGIDAPVALSWPLLPAKGSSSSTIQQSSTSITICGSTSNSTTASSRPTPDSLINFETVKPV